MEMSHVVHAAVQDSKDTQTRRLLIVMAIFALLCLFVASWAARSLWQENQVQLKAGESLARQVTFACGNQSVNTEVIESICDEARQFGKNETFESTEYAPWATDDYWMIWTSNLSMAPRIVYESTLLVKR